MVAECADAVEEVVERQREVSMDCELSIFVGTWNVNGGKNMHNVAFRNEASLADWIFAHSLS